MPVSTEFLSVPEAAKLIGITSGRVRQLILSGAMIGHKLNRRAWMVPLTEAERIRKTPRVRGRKRTGEKIKK